jgi:hypothetical protein
MYLLVAYLRSPEWEGEVAREVFDDLTAAEAQMAHWARFGVDSFCNAPSDIWIIAQSGAAVRTWDWRTRAPIAVPKQSSVNKGA